jgi:hypothetical protein
MIGLRKYKSLSRNGLRKSLFNGNYGFSSKNKVDLSKVLDVDFSKPKCYSGGTNVFDLSTQRHIGIFEGSGHSFDNTNGGRMYFSGASRINFGNNESLNLMREGTLILWAEISDWNGGNSYWTLAGKGCRAGYDSNGYALWCHTGYSDKRLILEVTNRKPIEYSHASNVIGTESTIGASLFHTALSWNMDGTIGYLNGELEDSTYTSFYSYKYGAGDTYTPSAYIPYPNFYLGCSDGLRMFKGYIYKCEVFKRALSGEEIKINFLTHKSRFNL